MRKADSAPVRGWLMMGAAAAVREDKADVFYFGVMTQDTLGMRLMLAL